ncbi:hypothetical protein WJX72_003941 [[Myrmecia] bisecta]|uniref:BZIP domain-containing protein n=1 Tax=[Myrmecia] bisecta TaxID=41462 RepID=A0AAW1PGT9_9CHLO
MPPKEKTEASKHDRTGHLPRNKLTREESTEEGAMLKTATGSSKSHEEVRHQRRLLKNRRTAAAARVRAKVERDRLQTQLKISKETVESLQTQLKNSMVTVARQRDDNVKSGVQLNQALITLRQVLPRVEELYLENLQLKEQLAAAEFALDYKQK